jgi:hypothetical protein
MYQKFNASDTRRGGGLHTHTHSGNVKRNIYSLTGVLSGYITCKKLK